VTRTALSLITCFDALNNTVHRTVSGSASYHVTITA